MCTPSWALNFTVVGAKVNSVLVVQYVVVGNPLPLVALLVVRSKTTVASPYMNMLDEVEGDRFYGTRESYSHLSDVEWSTIERMSSTVGEEAIRAMLFTRDRDQQHSVIIKLLQRELDESRAQVTLWKQQDYQRTKELRHHQSQYALPMRERRQESFKLEISKYQGVEDYSLIRWFVEVDGVIDARRIRSVVRGRGLL